MARGLARNGTRFNALPNNPKGNDARHTSEIKLMPLDQTLALYRVLHAALDTECADESAAILSQAMRDLALHYKQKTGIKIGVALGWAA